MSALQQNPINRNYLLSHNFQFYLMKLPEVNFFCTKIHVAGLNSETAPYSTPTFKLPLTGDHPTFENFVIEFLVDEDLCNWQSVNDWIRGDTFPDGNYEYKNLKDNKQPGMGLEADAIVYCLDASKQPIRQINYYNCKPISLSGFDFDTQVIDTNQITAQATFVFDTFKVTKII